MAAGPSAAVVAEHGKEERFEYLVDDTLLDDDKPKALPYCSSKHLEDARPEAADWGSIVIGEDENDGWLRCGEVYLPMALQGVSVVTLRMFPPVLMPVRQKPELRPMPDAGTVAQEVSATESPTSAAQEGVPQWTRTTPTTQEHSSRGEARLPALQPTHWLAPGGMRAPHQELVRLCPDDLQEAALRGDVSLVRKMIQAGISVNTPIRALGDDEFLTLLHVLACRRSITNGVRILAELLKSEANPDVRSSLGSTPLMFACLHKHVAAVEVLLNAGASTTAVDDQGSTALCCAMIPDPDFSRSPELAVELVELLGRGQRSSQ